MNQKPERPVVFAEFRGKEILREMGRLLFSLLDVFVSAGYRIQLFDNLPASELGKYGPLAFALPHLSVTNTLPADTRQMIYLFDERDPAAGAFRLDSECDSERIPRCRRRKKSSSFVGFAGIASAVPQGRPRCAPDARDRA